jgi:hypothetical protein
MSLQDRTATVASYVSWDSFVYFNSHGKKSLMKNLSATTNSVIFIDVLPVLVASFLDAAADPRARQEHRGMHH